MNILYFQATDKNLKNEIFREFLEKYRKTPTALFLMTPVQVKGWMQFYCKILDKIVLKKWIFCNFIFAILKKWKIENHQVRALRVHPR